MTLTKQAATELGQWLLLDGEQPMEPNHKSQPSSTKPKCPGYGPPAKPVDQWTWGELMTHLTYCQGVGIINDCVIYSKWNLLIIYSGEKRVEFETKGGLCKALKAAVKGTLGMMKARNRKEPQGMTAEACLEVLMERGLSLGSSHGRVRLYSEGGDVVAEKSETESLLRFFQHCVGLTAGRKR